MPSRLDDYRALLSKHLESGYTFITVEEFASRLLNAVELPKRSFVLRCDVDSDLETTRSMFDITRELGVRSTWYFRLCTLDAKLMRDISESGSEIGYHFEELATVAKRKGARNLTDVERLITSMEEEFCWNLENRYLPAAGAFPRTVASHGDFANRWLKRTNSCLVTGAIRARFNILAETYDPVLTAAPTRRFSDDEWPKWWNPHSPLDNIPSEGADVTYVLVHPRKWHPRWVENTRLDIDRALEGFAFRQRQKRYAG